MVCELPTTLVGYLMHNWLSKRLGPTCQQPPVARPVAPHRLVSFTAALLLAGASAVGAQAPQYGFYTVTPCRLIDTRNAPGPFGGPALLANSNRSFTVTSHCGVPSTADAVSLNVTVTQATSSGDLAIYPGGTALPMTSSVNYSAGRTRANNGSYKLGTAGDFVVHCGQGSGSVQLIVDINGYFETQNTGGGPSPQWSQWYQGSGD